MGQQACFDENVTKHNIRVNIINGMMAAVVANLVTPYFPTLAKRLGAGDFHQGLLTSLPAAIAIFTLIPGAILIDSFKNKKKITGSIMFANKIFYLLLAMVPFLNGKLQPTVFVVLIGLMNFPGSIGVMGFQSSIGDIFEGEILGNAMALRNRYSSIIGMITAYLSAELITKLPKTEGHTIILYQIFLVITFLIGLGEVISYFRFRGIKGSSSEGEIKLLETVKATIKTIPGQKKYIIFTICSLIFYFGWQMGWPLFNMYTMNNLQGNEQWFARMAIASSVSSILTYTLWAKYANKKGSNFALAIATIGMSITPFLYALSRSLVELVIFNVIIGVSVAGTTQILFNMLIEVTPTENRTIYIAIYNTLINFSAVISPIIGVAIANSLSIHIALCVTGVLRFIGSVSFFISYRYIKKME